MSEPLRFIHCADLHLDCPLGGLAELPDGLAQKARKATFSAFIRLIDEAIARKVDFVVIAGDIFNSKDKSLLAQLIFRDGMARLAEAGIDVFIVHGNHDPLDGWAAEIAMPSNVHRFGGDGVACVPFLRNGYEAARVFGISYPHRAVLENLAAQFILDNKNVPAIAILHCLVGGTTGHERYAPTTKEELLASGFDYWALGHVHTKAVINDNHPAIAYSGNIQGLHRNETGERGCYLVEMNESRDCLLKFLPLDTIRFETLRIDVSDAATVDEIITRISTSCREMETSVDLIISIELTGRTSLHSQLYREGCIEDILDHVRDLFASDDPTIWIESIRIRTASFHDVEKLKGREDFVGDVLSIFNEISSAESGSREALVESLKEITFGWTGAGFITLPDKDELSELINEARQQTLDELLGEASHAD